MDTTTSETIAADRRRCTGSLASRSFRSFVSAGVGERVPLGDALADVAQVSVFVRASRRGSRSYIFCPITWPSLARFLRVQLFIAGVDFLVVDAVDEEVERGLRVRDAAPAATGSSYGGAP